MTIPPSPSTPGVQLTEDRRKHLDHIQTTIGRMAANSGLAKGWALTVATAAYGYAVTKPAWPVALVGLLAITMFGLVDANYLRQERLFRHLYDEARLDRVEVYVMDPSAYRREDRCRWKSVLASWSVRWFYGPIVAAGAISALTAYVMSR